MASNANHVALRDFLIAPARPISLEQRLQLDSTTPFKDDFIKIDIFDEMKAAIPALRDLRTPRDFNSDDKQLVDSLFATAAGRHDFQSEKEKSILPKELQAREDEVSRLAFDVLVDLISPQRGQQDLGAQYRGRLMSTIWDDASTSCNDANPCSDDTAAARDAQLKAGLGSTADLANYIDFYFMLLYQPESHDTPRRLAIAGSMLKRGVSALKDPKLGPRYQSYLEKKVMEQCGNSNDCRAHWYGLIR